MKILNTRLSGIALGLAFYGVSAWAAIPAHPGMLNYVEGQAQINHRVVTSRNVGAADVPEGQVIETGAGKAEILLTPGVFLRLGDNTAVRMDSAGLTDTRVAILNGKAMVEADNLQKGNHIRILDGEAVSTLEKNGIYSFTANPGVVSVYDGKLDVNQNDRNVELGKGHQVFLQAALQSTKFDRKAAEENDPLYQWSKVRSQYVAEANVHQASAFVVNNAGWYGPGWYWDPWFSMYSWVPGDGLFMSPFGYGFYSPFTVWQAPVFYYGGHRGYRGVGRVGGGVVVPRTRVPAFQGGGFHRGGFQGGGFHGGGFHGGGVVGRRR
jgi:hypothetical protein